MAKDSIYIWLALAIGAILLLGTGGLFSVFIGDDYLNYDDFLVPEPIFNRVNELHSYSDLPSGAPYGTYTIQDDYPSENVICVSTIRGCNTGTCSKIDMENTVCTDDMWNIRTVYSPLNGGYRSQFFQNGDVRMELTANSGKSSSYIKALKNFKGNDIRLSFTMDYITGSKQLLTGVYNIYINDQLVVSGGQSINEYTSITENHLFELYSSKLNPDDITIYMDGNLVQDMTIPEQELLIKLSITGSNGGQNGIGTLIGTVNELKYKIPFSCTLGPDDFLALESFGGGQEIGLYSMRYPVKSFCLDHPVIRTSSTGSDATAEPYQKFIQGKTVSIPSDQTWTVFYVMHNDGSIPLSCPGEAYDVENNRCTSVGGIIQICSQGIFDPATGLCVVTPDVSYICPEGGYYDTAQGVCVYHPPIQYICDVGTYSPVSGKCEYTPDIQAVCSDGFVYNSATDKCEYTPETAADCPQGTIYNSATDKCEYNPDTEIVCPSQTTYNPISGFCEMFPSSQIICDPFFAYDSTLDKCVKSPDTEIICPSNTIFNSATDKCEYTPETANICYDPFVYNSATDMCEYEPPLNIICSSGGTYDSSSDTCIKNPATDYSCTTGVLNYDETTGLYSCIYTPEYKAVCDIGTYDISIDKCIFYPDTQGVCSKGTLVDGFCQYEADIMCLQGTYNTEIDACIYTPDLKYLCMNGKLKTDEDGQYCEIRPPTTIVCMVGCYYNETAEKCACVEEGEIVPGEPIVTVNKTITDIVPVDNGKMKIVYILIIFGIAAYVLIEAGPSRGFFRRR